MIKQKWQASKLLQSRCNLFIKEKKKRKAIRDYIKCVNESKKKIA